MRNVGKILAALALASAFAVGPSSALPVAAAGPGHAVGGPSMDVTIEAGQMCPFALHWVQDASKMRAITFTQGGDTVVNFVGSIWSTLTNLSKPETSIVVGGGAHARFVFHADGTLDISSSGTAVLGYFPADPPGAGLWLLNGRMHDTMAADGVTTTTHEPFIGRVENLCEVLE